MKTTNKITVNAQADKVWTVLADEFSKNDQWMAQVFLTRDADNSEGNSLGARVCELTPTLNGIRTYESILKYDKNNYTLVFNVSIQNGGKLPVKKNIATVTLCKEDKDKTLVLWETSPSLKPAGYLLYPVLKLGIQKSFGQVLEELKYYVETGEPHPRKVAASKKVTGKR